MIKNFIFISQILVLIFCFEYKNVNGQTSVIHKYTNCPTSEKYAYAWYFGNNAGMDFNQMDNLEPAVISGVSNINQFEGCAGISDSLGNFQFCTTGFETSLINYNFNYIENGRNISANYSSTQSSVIIPVPDNPDLYYLFAVNIPYYDNGLTYSVINMNLNNGEGKVVEKNVLLREKVCEKITAVKHANNKDIWVITHEWGTDMFLAYLISSSGIKDPIPTNIGMTHTADMYFNNAIGYMKSSPNGKKIALAVYGLNTLEILDFNNETGVVSNPITSTANFTGAYGIEFSPDGSKLYATTIDLMGSQTFISYLMQFNIEEGINIFNNYSDITTETNGIYFCALQLAPDGKIYIAKSPLGNDHLDVIYNPNRPGSECNYNYLNNSNNNGIDLNGGLSKFGLPNFIQSYFYIPKFTIDSCCQKNVVTFNITNLANIDSVKWAIKSNSLPLFNSNSFTPSFYFDEPGIYDVVLTDYFNGVAYEDKLSIEIFPEPEVDIGEDTTFLYLGRTITFDAGLNQKEYEWQNGSNLNYITTSDTGLFWVEVTDYKCCKNTDSTYVVFIDMFIPNAFTPNNDGINDKVYIRGDFFRAVDMKIFNRLGETVFHTTVQDIGWDGTYNGVEQDMGVYFYYFKGIFSDGTSVERKGNITLIR